jgi:hypothetical protein
VSAHNQRAALATGLKTNRHRGMTGCRSAAASPSVNDQKLGVRIAALKPLPQVSSNVMIVRMVVTGTHLDRLLFLEGFFQNAPRLGSVLETKVTQHQDLNMHPQIAILLKSSPVTKTAGAGLVPSAPA